MAFFKKIKDTGEIVSAGSYVYGVGYTLTADNRNEHHFPVDGWHWFDSEEEAVLKLNKVTRLLKSQAKLALANTPSPIEGQSLYDLVELYMMDPTTPVSHRIAWYDAQFFDINSPSLKLIASMFSLSDEQVDALFALGATFETF